MGFRIGGAFGRFCGAGGPWGWGGSLTSGKSRFRKLNIPSFDESVRQTQPIPYPRRKSYESHNPPPKKQAWNLALSAQYFARSISRPYKYVTNYIATFT